MWHEKPRNLSLRSKRGERTWEIARYLPHQGEWSVYEYMRIIEPLGIEFNKGMLEFLPWPNNSHQESLSVVLFKLHKYLKERNLGTVIHRVRLRLSKKKFREPDILVALNEHRAWVKKNYFQSCDLVVEVVSPTHRKLDLIRKRKEYAVAGIPEYWIVDHETGSIVVLKLDGKQYIDHGVFKRGEQANSALLNGFSVDVSSVLDAE